jgi:hypothetical protein
VREEAVESLVRAGGVVRASKLLATSSGEAISCLLELLEFENDLVALEALERFADHPDADVRETVQRVALALRPDFRGSAAATRRLERLF